MVSKSWMVLKRASLINGVNPEGGGLRSKSGGKGGI